MSETTPKSGRKPPGTAWKPGQSGNPAGKPKGTRNKATILAQALIDGKADALLKKALEMALAGDGPILRAMLDRLCPPRKDSPVTLEVMPKIESVEDLTKATGAILEAVATGQISPSEGQAIAGLVELHRRAIETTEIEERLSALEAKEKERR